MKRVPHPVSALVSPLARNASRFDELTLETRSEKFYVETFSGQKTACPGARGRGQLGLVDLDDGAQFSPDRKLVHRFR
jgi:hypothetical protein